MSIDLHIHSSYSDGSLSPDELVRLAHKKGLKAISLTDHDSVEGVEEAVHLGKGLGLEVVSGLELSVGYGQITVHLLGYGVDIWNNELFDALALVQKVRTVRNHGIVKKLNDLGIAITLEEVEALRVQGLTGRPHFAKLMVKKGVVRTIDEAFSRYLAFGAVAYVKREVLTIEEAIRKIHRAGGLAVLAHPSQVVKRGYNIEKVTRELVALELDGLEVYYPSHTRSFRKQLLSLVDKYNLIATGGSDYHGDIRPGTTLAGGSNVHVPLSVLTKLQTALEKKLRCEQ